MDLSKFLCCPDCRGDLSDAHSHIFCVICGKKFPLKDGVPIFIDRGALPSHLRGQIKYFEDEKITANEEHHLEAWQRKYLERFLDNNPSVNGKLIADCGTGSAYMAIELAKRGGYVIATDLSLRSAIRLRRIADHLGLGDRIMSVCSTAESLPIRNNCVSAFISNAVLEHIQNELMAISEMGRVTKEAAHLMLSVPLAYYLLNPLFIPLNWVHDKRIGHLRRYDEELINRKFSDWLIKRTYYTGHTIKVVKTIVNFIHPIFDIEHIEAQDDSLCAEKQYASNIICFLAKK
jgi:ubiquinone/menaquinone biosynthesis C-methylase UbiE/uncharacterized protein YbaR (Trm112 family)